MFLFWLFKYWFCSCFYYPLILIFDHLYYLILMPQVRNWMLEARGNAHFVYLRNKFLVLWSLKPNLMLLQKLGVVSDYFLKTSSGADRRMPMSSFAMWLTLAMTLAWRYSNVEALSLQMGIPRKAMLMVTLLWGKYLGALW